jgi:methionine-rich copper-binding protein CopC
MTRAATIVTLALLASPAFAHTKLAGSEPAANTSLPSSVATIVLEFSDEVRLTAVTLADATGAQKALGSVSAQVAAKFTVEVREPLAPGDYLIAWRAVGADTHVVSGEIPFSVAAAAHAH